MEWHRLRRWTGNASTMVFATFLLAGCAAASREPANLASTPEWDSIPAEQRAFLDTLAHRTFDWFWDTAHEGNRLTPDRWPTRSFASVGGSGFALTAYVIGAERGWVSREAAAVRVRETLEFFANARQDTSRSGATGYRGFYYHFLDPATGTRFAEVELSTVDTGLMLMGALLCRGYFDGESPAERVVRALADTLEARADWQWASVRPPVVALGWSPESGHLPYDWRGYNETLFMHVLAMGSPTHPLGPETYTAWKSRYHWGTFEGQEHLGFTPLFGHQYSHVWIDFRGIQDEFMREKGIDYFENSRRATLAQRAYAIANPSGFAGYDSLEWGLTACDGPIDRTLSVRGRERTFRTYAARGASFTEVVDDGTLAPTAVGGSVAFAPEVCVPALMAMAERHGQPLYGRYGFVDAFNPTLGESIAVQHGRVIPGVGWYDTDYLAIDQGPILAMIENLRSGLVWNVMRRDPSLRRGLERAGFSGGWLSEADAR